MADLLQGSDVFDGSRGDVEDGPHHSSGSGENEDARKLSGDLSLSRRDESDFGHFRNSKKSNNYLSSLQIFNWALLQRFRIQANCNFNNVCFLNIYDRLSPRFFLFDF
jgi:hypothetical protein